MASKKRTSRKSAKARRRSSRRSGDIAAVGASLRFETEIGHVFHEEEVNIRAIDGATGKVVGSILLEETKRERTYQVAQIYVSGEWRRGIATQLWEQSAAYAWQRRRYALASDVRLNSQARGFWEKQVRLGRARCVEVWEPDNEEDEPAGGCRQYILQTPPPLSLR